MVYFIHSQVRGEKWTWCASTRKSREDYQDVSNGKGQPRPYGGLAYPQHQDTDKISHVTVTKEDVNAPVSSLPGCPSWHRQSQTRPTAVSPPAKQSRCLVLHVVSSHTSKSHRHSDSGEAVSNSHCILAQTKARKKLDKQAENIFISMKK